MRIKGTSPYSFRAGEWATVIGKGMVAPKGLTAREVYICEYVDGFIDLISIDDRNYVLDTASEMIKSFTEKGGSEDSVLRQHSELERIVKRCGGWECDGHWVQGTDTVEYKGPMTVHNTAENVPINERHLYTKAVVCSCGQVMATTRYCGTFCRSCHEC